MHEMSSTAADVLWLQVRFSPDGRWLATASFDKGIKLWDGFKGSFVASLRCRAWRCCAQHNHAAHVQPSSRSWLVLEWARAATQAAQDSPCLLRHSPARVQEPCGPCVPAGLVM